MEIVRKLRDIKLVTTQKRRNCLESEPNCHTTNFFKMQILLNKPVYLGLSILTRIK